MLTIFKADSKQGVKMGLTKFHVHCIPCNWEIKDESFSGLFISSFFSLPFCCFPSKTPILFLEKTFLMSMPGGCLLYTWRCFRSVKFEEALCSYLKCCFCLLQSVTFAVLTFTAETKAAGYNCSCTFAVHYTCRSPHMQLRQMQFDTFAV